MHTHTHTHTHRHLYNLLSVARHDSSSSVRLFLIKLIDVSRKSAKRHQCVCVCVCACVCVCMRVCVSHGKHSRCLLVLQQMDSRRHTHSHTVYIQYINTHTHTRPVKRRTGCLISVRMTFQFDSNDKTREEKRGNKETK